MVEFYGKDSLQHTLGWQPKRPSYFLPHLSTISSQQFSFFLLKDTSLCTSGSSDMAFFLMHSEKKKANSTIEKELISTVLKSNLVQG